MGANVARLNDGVPEDLPLKGEAVMLNVARPEIGGEQEEVRGAGDKRLQLGGSGRLERRDAITQATNAPGG